MFTRCTYVDDVLRKETIDCYWFYLVHMISPEEDSITVIEDSGASGLSASIDDEARVRFVDQFRYYSLFVLLNVCEARCGKLARSKCMNAIALNFT